MTWLVNRLPAMLLGVLTALLVALLLTGQGDLPATLQVVLMGGFLGWILRADQREHTLAGASLSLWKQTILVQSPYLVRAGCLALLTAANFGLYINGHSPISWVDVGIIGGCVLLSTWLLQVVLLGHVSLPLIALPRPVSHWRLLFHWFQITPVRQAFWTMMILSLGLTLGYGLINTVEYGVINGLDAGLCYGTTIFLLSNILDGHFRTVKLAEKISWTRQTLLQWRHLRASLLFALALFCLQWLRYGLRYGSAAGPIAGPIAGLVGGPSIALGAGLGDGLLYWLLIGLYKGIIQKHLEVEDRRSFNEGLRNSLRNGAILSLLGAVIIVGGDLLNSLLGNGLIGVLARQLSEGLIFGLNKWLSNAGLLFLYSWVVLWAATVGLTILRHYLLRLLLAYHHIFPLHARRFLDDSVARVLLKRFGGGYEFVHRQLLNHFANTASNTLEGRKET